MERLANRKQSITGGVSGFYGVRERDGKFYGYFGGVTFDGGITNSFLQSTDPVLYEVDLQNQDVKKLAPRFDGEGYRRWIVGEDGKVSATLDFHSKGGSWSIRNRDGDRIVTGTNPLGGIGLVGLGDTSGSLIYSVEDEEEGGNDWFEVPLKGGDSKVVLEDVYINEPIFDPRVKRLIGYELEADTPAYKFLDPYHQKVIEGTLKALPGVSVHLQDWNDRFDKLIVMTEGVGDPQTWWMVDIKTGKASILGTSYPMRQQEVAPMHMVRYKAGDGLDIAAVLTLPPGKPAKSLPVVVLPHGGPHYRDYPGFDWWAQAFAARGYAVLQPNFRGSTGYGPKFEHAGDGQWGLAMQTDISDGLAYLVKEDIVDPKRACIMGGSYGGYAALAGVTLQKGLYRCAVAVAGVSDVSKMVSTDIRESGGDQTLRRAFKSELGSGKDLRVVSPIRFAEAADAPILLIHGKEDIVVPYEQSVAMAKALRAADKPVEFVTLPGEDHWLSKGATRLAMLEAALAFIEKHNPAQ